MGGGEGRKMRRREEEEREGGAMETMPQVRGCGKKKRFSGSPEFRKDGERGINASPLLEYLMAARLATFSLPLPSSVSISDVLLNEHILHER